MREVNSFRESDKLLVFDHIPKTGGHTIRQVLQQNFGWGHIDAEHTIDYSKLSEVGPDSGLIPLHCMAADPPQVYSPKMLRCDLTLHPQVRSVASHMVVPFVDFGSFDERLLWFSMFREPTSRFLSHYQMKQGDKEEPLDLHEWARRLPLKNQQTHWIAGRPDVEAAKQIIREKFFAVGLVEEFDKSLLIFRRKLGPWFVVGYPRAQNVAKDDSLRKHVRANWDEYEEVVQEWNALDLELYDFVREEIWSEQVAAYGERRLERDESEYFDGVGAPGMTERVKRLLNVGFRRTIYRPFTSLTR